MKNKDYRVFFEQQCHVTCPFFQYGNCLKYNKTLVKTNFYYIRCGECIKEKDNV